MKRVVHILLGLSLGLFLVPSLSYAAEPSQSQTTGPIIRSGDVVSIDASQSLEGDFYGLGTTVTISGPSKHDTYVLGSEVTVNAPVAEDLVIIGGTVQVHSDIADDLRVIGGDVTLGGEVKGDVVVVGGTFTMLSTAHVSGDIIFFGGSLVVEGAVDGTIHGYAQTARINATVGTDITMTISQTVTLGDRAHIAGNISYTSGVELSRAQQSIVEGSVHRNTPVVLGKNTESVKTFTFVVLSLLFLVAALMVFARSKIVPLVRSGFARPGQNGLIGLGIVLIAPFVSMLLLVSVVGIPLSLCMIALYIAALPLSIGFSIFFLGYTIERVFFKNDRITPVTLVLGVCAWVMFFYIPYIGIFILWALCLIGVGVAGGATVRWLRS